MTKDDAIAILQGVAKYLMSGNEIMYSDKLMLALDVAIDALEKVEKPNEDVPDINFGDMISRQSAINIVYFECGEWEGLAKTIVKDINDLPSVQPEIIHCRDCKHWQSEEHIGNNNVHTLNIASLPCKNWLTGGDWYCGSAERRSNE